MQRMGRALAAVAPSAFPVDSAINVSTEASDEVTLKEYFMGRDLTYAALLTPAIRQNATETCRRWNQLLKAFTQSTGIRHRGCRSGWRPQAVNERTPGAAPNSRHITAEAMDAEDPDKALGAFVVAHPELVSAIGLWFEDPFAKKPDGTLFTPSWVHGQIVAPRSGRRYYIPF